MGMLNLFVDGVLRDGARALALRRDHGACCMAAALPLVVRQRASRWHTFGLVLLGDLIYLVVVLCIDDPVRYATPLMLLFPSFVAAWFLGRWELAVNMVRHRRRSASSRSGRSYDSPSASASRSGSAPAC